MKVAAAFALLGLTEARYYAGYYGAHCYVGHGGTPLHASDTPVKNITGDECKGLCDKTTNCAAYTRHLDANNRHDPYGDCYLRSEVNLTDCETSASKWGHASWATYQQVDPPAKDGFIVYHLFEAKYTGLANRDAGDFKGDSGFIFDTFASWAVGNPEASLEHNIIEMSNVSVSGWGQYEECNAPGAEGLFTCPANQTEYCCTVYDENHHSIPSKHTRDQLPGLEVSVESLGSEFGFPGWWVSFPKESEKATWNEQIIRRVSGKCVGDAWRKDAGGCSDCGDELDSCVADCVKAALCENGSVTKLQATWDRVFASPTECPDVPFPSESVLV